MATAGKPERWLAGSLDRGPTSVLGADDPGDVLRAHPDLAYGSAPGLSAPPIPRFTATYSDATRSLAIAFASPLASHQTVRIELLEGIVAANGRPFEPWTFVFSTGN